MRKSIRSGLKRIPEGEWASASFAICPHRKLASEEAPPKRLSRVTDTADIELKGSANRNRQFNNLAGPRQFLAT
jgi:hypothetical protein